MSTIRVKKDAKYSVIKNELLEDESLSWEARGVMAYLLSKPDNWIVRTHDLINQGPAGERKIRSILRELKQAGYMLRVRERREGNKGRFEWVTEIYESKQLNPSILLLCTCGQRTSGQCTCGQCTSGQKPHIVSTESIKTESIKTKEISTEGGRATRSPAAALDIYLSVTKIKSVEKIPEVVTDWLGEQEQYMGVYGHPEALRQAIKDADKEKQVFSVEFLEGAFMGNIPEVKSAGYSTREGEIILNWVEMTNGDRLHGDSIPDWIKGGAMGLVKRDIAAKESANQQSE